ncbi:tyrosine-type recombinase/integrase [Streptomyces sp. NPDC052301]|uniref:tyrosine-type recombinase/integrase n=1 Tax=Streptomyces sp. NPDC052301 TaxID=3365687 RepID=UPI0037CD3BC6
MQREEARLLPRYGFPSEMLSERSRRGVIQLDPFGWLHRSQLGTSTPEFWWITFRNFVVKSREWAPFGTYTDGNSLRVAVAHAAAGLAKPSTVGARRVLKGHEAERKKSTDFRRRPRRAAAATPPVLRKMVTATDTTTAIGRRDVAILLLGFALAARRSELRLLDWADLEEVEEGLAVQIWRPKVNHEGPLGVPYGSNPATCPVRALRAWRQYLTDHGHQAAGPLFVRIDRHSRIAHPMHRNGQPIGDPTGRITGEGIGDAITRAATRAQLTAPTELLPDLPPRWSGHSLRRGFATAAKQAGKDLIETARHGGWVDGSKSLAGYFEQAGMWDETNPLYGIGL